MSVPFHSSRRSFLAAAAAFPLGIAAAANGKPIPVGLELYSVRDDLKSDLPGTLHQVGEMGYQCVEFYAPYFDWTPEYAKQVRRKLDDLGLRCYSTHNGLNSFTADGLTRAMDLNGIIGAHYLVLAHPGSVHGQDGWKQIIETLNHANDKLSPHGMNAGYHNHDLEWHPLDGQKPIEMIAAGTDKSIMLQLDVGTCVATGNDPVAWINRNPGRIRSVHCKDWSPDRKYRVLFGEGTALWKKIFDAAEATGGVEFYLIEQEGSDHSEIETAQICLANWKKLRGQGV